MAFAKNKFSILYVDDELNSLKYFKKAFDDLAPIFTAANAEEGLEVFAEHLNEIGVVVSDEKMPGMSGIEFLTRVRKIDAAPLRVLLTAHTDLNLAVEGLNDGLLYSYLTKPWDPRDMNSRLARALDRFWITKERKKLLGEREMAFQEMMMEEKVANIHTLSIGLNHHMKNALTVIQSYFDMIPLQLQKEIEGAPKDQFFWSAYYQNVEEQISRVLEIITNFSERSSGMEFASLDLSIDVDLATLIEKAVEEELGDAPACQFKMTKMDDLGIITADLGKVSLLVRYLIREAKKNIPNGGEIEVQLFTGQLDGADSVRIRFIDNGTPIPEEERARIFDPFFVRSDRPSELGTDLLHCYLTVFHHGGTIEARSLKDKRNMIEFILPKVPTLKPKRDFLSDSDAGDGGQKNGA